MKTSLSLAAVVATTFVGAANAAILYTNPWAGGATSYASQNDIAGGGYGNFATCYGFFSTGGATWNVTDLHFVGQYFNPPAQAPIAGFTIQIWGDAGNVPGAFLGGTYVAAGSFTETFVGGATGASYLYDMNLNPTLVTGDAWVSIIPDVAFPPQWGWDAGVDANPAAAGWQVFFGTPGRLAESLNLQITGDVIPAPGAVALVGLAGFFGRRRRA
ncbi:MAG: hypothetical protein K8R92_00690 [Planctomycetes bacterium]|nr:hypothetical protein [Planctomycetota bacterium]